MESYATSVSIYPEHLIASNARTGGIERRSVPGRLTVDDVLATTRPLNIPKRTKIPVPQEKHATPTYPKVQTPVNLTSHGFIAARLHAPLALSL